MVSTNTKPGARGFSRVAKCLPAFALAVGIGLLAPAALAQHGGGGGGSHGGGGGGGGGFHGGGGGGGHSGGGGGGGGFHGGGSGGWHGGGWHGGGWNGNGWHGNGWHGGGWRGGGWGWRGGWGWGGWGYPGWGWGYPGWSIGLGGYYPGYDPYFDDGIYSPLASAPMYADPQYDPNAPGAQNYAPGNYAPTADGPVDNSRGFYRWQLGVENGSCNRPYVAQVVNNVTGNATTAALRPGDILGGISVAPVVGGRIGPRLDVSDQACATQVLERTNTGVPVHWQTASGIPVTFTINRTDDSGGRRCRTFTATATFASKAQSVTGTACKETDGSWQTMR